MGEGGAWGECLCPLPFADPVFASAGVEAAGRGGGQLEEGLCHRGLRAGEQGWVLAGQCCALSWLLWLHCGGCCSFGLQVKLLEVLERVDREGFEFMFGRELTYTTMLSDQRMVELIPNGSNTAVRYEDRKEFIRLVQKARLEESKEQVTLSPGLTGLQGDPAPVASHPGTCGIRGCQNVSPSSSWVFFVHPMPRMSMCPGDPFWGPVVAVLRALGGCPGLRPTVVTWSLSCAPTDRSHTCRAALRGAPARAGPAHLAADGEEDLRGPGDHSG